MGRPKNTHRTNGRVLVSVNQFSWGIDPPYSLSLEFSYTGETNFGTPEVHVEPRCLQIVGGWIGWSDSKCWFSTKIDLLCKVFFGAILRGKTRSYGEIVSGQILGNHN